MKITLSWLKDHLETDATVDEIAEALTSLGLEVEEVEDRGSALAAFTVGYVKSAEKHPNADKLRVCIVDTGRGDVQVVCGAPNARTGMKGVFAPAGTHIPGTGLDLKKGVIRGVESNGMLCSEREMGLSDAHEGIIDLAEDAPVGAPFAALMGLDDPVIDIALTPDRADCAGVRGIARDLAAKGIGTLKPLPAEKVPGRFESPIGVRFDFPEDDAKACPLFVGRLIRGVRNGSSPKWLQDKLLSVGLRPISALVDITNYFTIDRNRPLHVFDAGKVKGDLVLRLSTDGEMLAALNDKTYALEPGMTVICDDTGVVSLGGVMGGEPTGVTEETTEIFLEVALFDPYRTATTGRKLGIESDARYRFERGIDPAAVFDGMEQATAMILELCGGEPSEPVVAGREPEWRRTLHLRPSRVAALGGLDVPLDEQVRTLTRLGCEVATAARHAGEEDLAVVPPSWRADIEGEADLVEEVLRVRGYDDIPAVPMPRLVATTKPSVTPFQRTTGLVKRLLAARGMEEAVTWSFMAAEHAALFGFQNEGLRLVNPISSELDTMRPSVLPNLIQAAGRNADRGYADAALFEVGPVYRDAEPTGQDLVATGIRSGRTGPRHWAEAPRAVDAFDAKTDALAVLEAAGAPVANLQVTTDAPDWYHPGRSGVLRLGANVLAVFGEIHPAVLSTLDVAGPVAAFEVWLDRVPQPKKKTGPARPLLKLSPFQPVERDFAFLVDADVAADRVVRAARSADKALITDIVVFDDYRGQGVPEGRKSLAVT
ncbi:MAG TPA: phenylalanine--tRNA ligase subunit beta, partial [Alphaproteobacteria bacterium]|nr:phenylalanine--tRNA ligase subunit beta [Alphaproteobacteria bacterium]